MTDDVLQILDRNIAANQETVDLAAAVTRLKASPDFQKVILNGYLKDEAVRLVHLKAHPEFQTAERKASIDAQIAAVGNLHQWFLTVFFQAAQAE
ncbi:MAG: hypothetical protein ACTHKB_15805, partial [Burkholderiaceae bacterium]